MFIQRRDGVCLFNLVNQSFSNIKNKGVLYMGALVEMLLKVVAIKAAELAVESASSLSDWVRDQLK